LGDNGGEKEKMNYKQAYQSFVYHGERIYSPTGEENPYHELMRNWWAFIIENKLYKYLPDDPVEADDIIWQLANWFPSEKNVEKIRRILKELKRRKSLDSLPYLVRQIIGGGF
jgi:hypothetical protein